MKLPRIRPVLPWGSSMQPEAAWFCGSPVSPAFLTYWSSANSPRLQPGGAGQWKLALDFKTWETTNRVEPIVSISGSSRMQDDGMARGPVGSQ
jgi:hypothetical protein